jgi:glutaredoxin|tara:strand:+ start:976 stop:1446 length:471 start_codon:yes stop_codon:yes gene_type:complete
MKLYTNPTCHYCHKIKEVLDSTDIVYEEVVASENTEEWNELTRLVGIGMTPTIVFQDEVWLPNRDFRTPDELVQRIKHFREYPMRNLRLEERIDQAYNAIKNLTLLLNQMTQTIQTINSNITPKPQPTPNTAPPQHNQVPPQPTPNTVPPQPVHQA